MGIFKWISVLLLVSLISGKAMADAPCGTICPDIWNGFTTEDEISDIKSIRSLSRSELGKEAVLYFILGSDVKENKKTRREYLQNSISILKKLWKKNRRDNQNLLRLAYASMAICDTDIELEETVQHVSKALGYFSTVIERLPENMEARMGRLLININMPEGMRPEDLLKADATTFMTGYDQLTPEQRENDLIKMGYSNTLLAQALVMLANHQKDQAEEKFRLIDPGQLGALVTLYRDLEKTAF